MKWLCMVVLFLLSETLLAVDSSGNYAIWGVGNKSCHRYNLSRANDDDAKYRDYIMGYFTAYNHQAENTYSISARMNLEEIMTELDEECELKPIISFDEALINFIIQHHENRMKSAPGAIGR